jgi:hypothetical protein
MDGKTRLAVFLLLAPETLAERWDAANWSSSKGRFDEPGLHRYAAVRHEQDLIMRAKNAACKTCVK